MYSSLNTSQLLDRDFIDIRSKLIDLAASLDRIKQSIDSNAKDPRLEKIQQAIAILSDNSKNRTEQIQMLFSLPCD
jgi:hypothetical protein